MSWLDDARAAAAQWNQNAGPVTPINDVVEMVLAGNSRPLYEGSDGARTLAWQVDELSRETLSFASNLESAWTGQASEAANARVSKLGLILSVAGKTFDQNADNVATQASAFDYTKNNLTPLPAKPPEASFFERVWPGDSDTEKEIKVYNQKSAENHRVYTNYANATEQQSASLYSDYGDLGDFDLGDVVLVPEPGDQQPGPHDPGPRDPHTPGGTPVPTPHGVLSPPPPGIVTPSTHTPGSVDTGGAHSGGSTPPPFGHGDGTAAAGYVPPTPPTGGNPWLPGSGMVPGAGSGPGSGAGAGSGGVPFGGLGYAGGPGAPGSGSGGGAGAGGRGEAGRAAGLPTGGRQSGAGPMEGPATRGASGTSGTANRPSGAGGPGGLGQGARGGKGSDDEEHQRKYMLDNDSLFTEDDKKVVDPVNGLPPVPPTIGA